MVPLLKRAVTTALASLGYAIVPNWRLGRLKEAEYLARLFSSLDIDCVIDVGANTGQFAEFVRKYVGYQGLIVSLEPIPALVAQLRAASANDPKWEVRHLALGRTAGRARFYVTTNTEFSSFLTVNRDAYDFGEMTDVRESINVDVDTLDTLVPEIMERFGVRNIHLKLDTQGYDLEVLTGGERILDSIASLQTELAVCRIYDGMPDFREVSRYIEEHDFIISQFLPSNEGHFPILVDFDCCALHRSRVTRASQRRA
jgi:FkbM family methyltransferase